MDSWHWLIWGAAAIGLVVALVLLNRLCLWLEDHGWLYYRRKKPSSSPMSAWVAMQQFIEPGMKHVVDIRHSVQSESEQEAAKEQLLAMLAEILRTSPVNVEAIRLYLEAAQEHGLDWQALYDQALRMESLEHPGEAARLPSPEMVAPSR